VKRILVTGAGGQIGSELVPYLRKRYGVANVLATDLRTPSADLMDGGPFQILDATDPRAIGGATVRHRADTIYHLAAILSAVGERDPRLAYHVNMDGVHSVLEVAREQQCAVFVPSSIAAFGPSTPPDPTPQDTIQRPTSIYGITKVAGELLCDYYHVRFGVDTRGVRYPGLISYGAPPGGGTTDYAVEIFHAALKEKRYTCFLREDTRLPMMYMPDAIRATIELMDAPAAQVRERGSYNLAGVSFTPRELADEIARHVPGFVLTCEPDFRQAIADSWPAVIDDAQARADWRWAPRFDASAMVADMLAHLKAAQPAPTR
jgi:nucleoside-diphosphate-sugar epimerase